MIDSKKLIELSSYFSLIHQTKGRIRVRVSPKIKELDTNDVSLKDIESLSQKINGIKNIKINKIVGSITIEYDSAVFPDHLWIDLIEQRNLDELVLILNKLYKEIA